MMAKSAKRDVTDYDDCPRRFHRRRLLAFLHRNDLPSASAASKHRARVFSDVRLLRRLVSDGRWQDARAHLATRFLLPFPGRRRDGDDNLQAALGFIAQLHVLADLARGELGAAAAAEDLERQVAAIPPAMAADRHYAEAVRAVFGVRCHPAFWEDLKMGVEDPFDWPRVRLRASEIVGDLIKDAPQFKRLLRLPRRAIHPIPFGFGRRRRHIRKKQMPAASLVARFFHMSPWTTTQGGPSPERMELVEGLMDEALGDGYVGVREHNFRFSAQGIFPAADDNAAATAKRLDAAETSARGAAKRPRTTGGLYVDEDDEASPSSGMDPMHVFMKVNELQGVSNAMTHLVLKIFAHGSPERSICSWTKCCSWTSCCASCGKIA
ncbi:unnamed protein product [Urochloa decumbens]|uniref:Uncharacterized protein n=1 Tax=Urochloa decumbens TaxID=240449 RepID=A0ABC9DCT5_9POAL